MKKFMSLLLVLVLVLSMGTVALAAKPETANTSPTFKVTYKLSDDIKTNDAYPKGIVAPAQTFTYTFTADKVEQTTTVTQDKMPEITAVTAAFTEQTDLPTSDAASKEKTVTIDLSSVTWPGVGVYYYDVAQTVTDKALGVNYSTNEAHTLKVTVAQDPDAQYDQYYVAFVTLTANVDKDDDSNGVTDDKTNGFTNTYSANNLEVKKEVTGNMGDRSKEFEVDVKFTVSAAEGDPGMLSSITYNNGEAVTIGTNEWKDDEGASPATKSVTKTIKLKHDGTVTFQNLPVGVTYVVKEKDYTGENDGKYDAAQYSINSATAAANANGASSQMDNDGESVKVINNKGTNVDTGIGMDSLPYILLLAVVVVGLAVFFVKKRAAREN